MRSIRILLFALLLSCEAVASSPERILLVFGDSLSAAYGLRADQGWADLLQKRLQKEGYGYQRGERQRHRRDHCRADAPAWRGHLSSTSPRWSCWSSVPTTACVACPSRTRVRTLRRWSRPAGAPAPGCCWSASLFLPTTVRSTRDSFAQIYPQLASELKLPLVPFLLDGVALEPRLMQEDGLHPKAEGEPRVLDNVWQYLRPLLER